MTLLRFEVRFFLLARMKELIGGTRLTRSCGRAETISDESPAFPSQLSLSPLVPVVNLLLSLARADHAGRAKCLFPRLHYLALTSVCPKLTLGPPLLSSARRAMWIWKTWETFPFAQEVVEELGNCSLANGQNWEKICSILDVFLRRNCSRVQLFADIKTRE